MKIGIGTKKRIYIGAACALLALQLAFQFALAAADTQTSDEAIHMFSGYEYLTKGDFRYNPEHPPLMKYLAALPLLVLNPRLPTTTSQYETQFSNPYFFGTEQQVLIADDFLYHSGNNAGTMLFASRVPLVLVTLALGISVWLIAAYLWGWAGSLAAVALYCLDPLVNGSGHLVTNDILVSLTCLLALFLFWLFLRVPSWRNVLWLALLLGLAELSKFTALFLYPFMILALAAWLLWKMPGWGSVRGYLGKLLIVFIVSYCVIVTGYGFHMGAAPTQPIGPALSAANGLSASQVPGGAFTGFFYGRVRFLLTPWEYYLGALAFFAHADSGHLAYFLGQTSNTGWPNYFPLLFFLKTPLLTLLAFATALGFLVFRREKMSPKIYLLSAAVFYLFLSCFSKVDIGVRHLLPIYPLLFIFAGSVGESIFVFILAFLLLVQSLSIYPYYLSFFNLLAGGTWRGYMVAVDSNLDWGQDGNRIQAYLNAHHIENAYIEYWNNPAAPFTPTPGSHLVISATALFEYSQYAWLKSHTPSAQITPSVFLFSF
jgi:4-amino-4-deoxy-L-arabinose transferase-like glycosyltransferase